MGNQSKQKTNPVGKTFSVLGAVLIIVVILTCIPITIPRLMGYHIYNVISGSMEPNISVGSLIYTKSVPPEEIQEGDVITFYSDSNSGAIITHRVVTNKVVSGEFVTKGDANEKEDMNPVKYSYYLGKEEYAIPFLGHLLASVATQAGKISLAVLLAAAVLFRITGNLISGRQEQE